MMVTRTQNNRYVSSDEWYTPKSMIDDLGPFDLDPCSPVSRPFDTAKIHYTREDDGLSKDWGDAFVWLNPPYSRNILYQFIEKLSRHNNGIALLMNRLDNLLWYETIFPHALSMIFLRRRIKFLRPDGQTGRPPTGHCLVAFGKLSDERLRDCHIEGKYVRLNYTKEPLSAVPDSPEDFVLGKSRAAGTFNSQQAVLPVADAFSALKMKDLELRTEHFVNNMSGIMADACPAPNNVSSKSNDYGQAEG